ncbi:alpha-galactosidase [candidate division KSB1 bacterium]
MKFKDFEIIRKLLCLLIIGIIVSTSSAQFEPLSNNFYSIEYNLNSKVWNLYEKKGNSWKSIFNNAAFSITIDSIKYQLNSPSFRPSLSKIVTNDALGRGESIKITFAERTNRFEVTALITLYDNIPYLAIGLTLRNTSADTLTLKEADLIDVKDDFSGIFSDYREDAKILINGFQSWGRSEVQDLSSAFGNESYWLTAFYSKRENFFKIFGFLTNTVSTNKFKFNLNEEIIQFRSTCDFYKKVLYPGDELAGDKLVIVGGEDIYRSLQDFTKYANTLSNEMNIRDYNFIKSNIDITSIPSGWCSWYYYYTNVTQADIINNLNFANDVFKEYGLEYIQIDDGYQVSAGDWETNEKFPDGHRWLVNQIHNAGLKAGLWVAPFAVSERSPIFFNRPEWLLKDENGENIVVFNNQSWGGNIYILDPTNPEVYEWLVVLFSRIANIWNYDYVKIDFLYFVTLGKKFYENVTPIEAYRTGLRAIREGVGSEKFILGCGAPLFPSIGFVDGMRIGTDVLSSWEGIIPCAESAANRSYLHQNLWNNDPDCVVIREPLNFVEATAWASFVALSGSMNLFGDNLTELNHEKIDILKKTLPVYNKPFTPVDMFDLKPGIKQGITPLYGEKTFDIELPNKWFFKTGDDPEWKNTSVNEMDWDIIDIPLNWENAGYEDYDGYAWYRAHFSTEDITPQDLKIQIGKIDDADEVYLNGKLIGKTGEFPPDYRSEYAKYRTYSAYQNDLNWEEDNILAIRVYDGGGSGGLYETVHNFPPEIYQLSYEKDDQTTYIVGIFNWKDEVSRYSFLWSDLKIPYWESYLAYDFWNNNFMGEIRDTLNISLNPNSCKVLSIKRKLDIPQIVSTSRHITQGAVDLKRVSWNSEVMVLNAESENLVISDDYSVTVYIPEGLSFVKCQSEFEHEVFQIDENTIQITFKVTKNSFEWSLLFEQKLNEG